MDEGRKRVLAIVAGILVARHLKTADELFDAKATPRTEAMIAAAVQWADRIMRKIDGVYGNTQAHPPNSCIDFPEYVWHSCASNLRTNLETHLHNA